MAYVIRKTPDGTNKELFDATKVTFRKPMTLDHGGKIIGLSYDNGPLYLQTPEMVMPYGINVYEDPTSGVVKHSVDLSFRGEEENERIRQFHAQLEQFQSVLVDAAEENSQSWFKKKQPREVLEAFFSPFLKKSVNKETGEPDGK